MSENELNELSIKTLLELADRTVNEYVMARANPNNSLLAEQKHACLNLLNKVITNKQANELP